jgi:heterotetrameric sarcosine oxidase alpha subunit
VKAQPNRLFVGGRIDRAATVTLRFDGRAIEAHPGDTLASAFLANGVRLVGRSFKYHRPRGIVSAGVEEPNALVHLRAGARGEPNTRATTAEVFDGLVAKSQNGWPSIDLDMASVFGALTRILPAGFYYKTFMGLGRGTRWWMMCEHFIRKAAGMGRAPQSPDPDGYEKVNAFCDVLVVGAGPAGLAAALAAGRAGARVLLVEQDFALGGTLLDLPLGGAADAWLGRALDELAALPNVQILTRTTAFGAYDGEVYGLVERCGDHLAAPPEHRPRQRYWLVRSKAAVLAAGAIERPLVFGGNDIPGVMLASGLRTYLNRFAVLCGRKIALCTTNDSVYATAGELAQAGAAVTVLDLRKDIPSALLAPAKAAGVDVLPGHAVYQAHGGKALRAVTFGPVDASGRIDAPLRRLDCDVLATSAGFVPNLHLWSHRGRRPHYDAAKQAFVPDPQAHPRLLCAGACAGEDTLEETVRTGAAQGEAAARIAGHTDGVGTIPALHLPDGGWSRDTAPVSTICGADGQPAPFAFVDLQHDVKCSDIDLAHREGYVSVEHLKRYTTAGMATDQGKTSNVNALARLAGLRGQPIAEVGTTTFRPPFTPVSFGAIVGREHGRHFRPTRLSPMHDWHAEQGAAFIDAGLWLRPWYYPRAGEDRGAAYVREAGEVRRTVGLVDVSSLGKIAVQGPDAAEFLDRLYVNSMRTLKVGRLRYGVMLRDDGFVFDDGVVARLSETEFAVSTTTANAAKVLANLEQLLQTAWTALKVQVTSVSDQWAAIAVAGPRSRTLLQTVCGDADLSAAGLPHMALTYAEIAGAPVRIHRMSYSGELAFELYVPAGFGRLVWESLMRAGSAFGVVAYGTEAMGALRIEKGHVAGGELDGRTTLKDLALERMTRGRSTFVGAVLRQRPGLEDPERPSLVGLAAIDPASALKPGCLVFSEQAEIAGHGEGHVTSTTFSPALGGHIGLALLARGEKRVGEIVRCVDLLGNSDVRCRVVRSCFVDPEGARQNA